MQATLDHEFWFDRAETFLDTNFFREIKEAAIRLGPSLELEEEAAKAADDDEDEQYERQCDEERVDISFSLHFFPSFSVCFEPVEESVLRERGGDVLSFESSA